MTSFALPAKVVFVHIILGMTSIAAGRSLYLLFHGFVMAGQAFQRLMGAIQLEFGVLVVIEIPNLPVPAVMAARAFRS